MSKFIRMVEVPVKLGQLTKRWDVENVENGKIGTVKWSTGFRRYAFYPDCETLYEADCLRHIADFIETRPRSTRANDERPS